MVRSEFDVLPALIVRMAQTRRKQNFKLTPHHFTPHCHLSSQLLNTFTFSRLTSTWASGAVGLSTVCRRELV